LGEKKKIKFQENKGKKKGFEETKQSHFGKEGGKRSEKHLCKIPGKSDRGGHSNKINSGWWANKEDKKGEKTEDCIFFIQSGQTRVKLREKNLHRAKVGLVKRGGRGGGHK